MERPLALVAVLIVGGLIALQPPVNSQLARETSILGAAFVSTAISAVVMGVIFFAAILAHIYIGSVGMEGAFWAMGNGEVDLAWARHHHDLWVQEQLGRAPQTPHPGAAGMAPTRAPDVQGP